MLGFNHHAATPGARGAPASPPPPSPTRLLLRQPPTPFQPGRALHFRSKHASAGLVWSSDSEDHDKPSSSPVRRDSTRQTRSLPSACALLPALIERPKRVVKVEAVRATRRVSLESTLAVVVVLCGSMLWHVGRLLGFLLDSYIVSLTPPLPDCRALPVLDKRAAALPIERLTSPGSSTVVLDVVLPEQPSLPQMPKPARQQTHALSWRRVAFVLLVALFAWLPALCEEFEQDSLLVKARVQDHALQARTRASKPQQQSIFVALTSPAKLGLPSLPLFLACNPSDFAALQDVWSREEECSVAVEMPERDFTSAVSSATLHSSAMIPHPSSPHSFSPPPRAFGDRQVQRSRKQHADLLLVAFDLLADVLLGSLHFVRLAIEQLRQRLVVVATVVW